MDKIVEIPIKDVKVIENTRANIKGTHIDELMLSIKQHGLKQPIGVSVIDKNNYQLIFGQRRLLACQQLGWNTISAIVTEDVDMKKLLILNLTENIQRKDPTFVEYGRGIEKLLAMKMTYEEVAARLGLEVDRVKQIAKTYVALPAKHRSKVQFVGKGGTAKGRGGIPVQIANQVVALKKAHGLSMDNTDTLIKYICETQMSKEDVKSLSVLLNSGLKLADAIEKLHDYHVYHVHVVVERSLVSKHMSQHGVGGAGLLFKKIIYGDIPPIKKPSFVKI